jgi:hypothetical protein
VRFLGVLYHLRHPLLALERICELSRDIAVIESHAIDNLAGTLYPIMEFYETTELGGQYDNWWGPTIGCLEGMIRSAGFVNTQVLHREPSRVVIKALRKWPDAGGRHIIASHSRCSKCSPSRPANTSHRTKRVHRSFSRRYFSGSIVGRSTSDGGGYGTRPVFIGVSGDPARVGATQVNVPVPPGLDPGAVDIQVESGRRWSEPYAITLNEGTEW